MSIETEEATGARKGSQWSVYKGSTRNAFETGASRGGNGARGTLGSCD